MIDDEYFWSFVDYKYKKNKDGNYLKAHDNKKMRKCLRCGEDFYSRDIGNRVCKNCTQTMKKMKKMAHESFELL